MIEILHPPATEKKHYFTNVTIYRSGEMFGINRTDCRSVQITTGVKYAQYNNAIRVVYVQKGKRTPRIFTLSYAPWLRICNTLDAIQPDEPLVANGNGSRISRYASCDPRWETDFEDKATAANVPWLLTIGAGKRESAAVAE